MRKKLNEMNNTELLGELVQEKRRRDIEFLLRLILAILILCLFGYIAWKVVPPLITLINNYNLAVERMNITLEDLSKLPKFK